MNRNAIILRKVLSVSLAAVMVFGGAVTVLPSVCGESLGNTVNALTDNDQGYFYQTSYGKAQITGSAGTYDVRIVVTDAGKSIEKTFTVKVN